MSRDKLTTRRCRGLLLAEAVIAIVVLEIAVLGLIYTVNAGQAHLAYLAQNVDATRVAEDMLEEILSKAYTDPDGGTGLGPDAGETSRSLYDDIDDYDGYSEAIGELKDASGNLYSSSLQQFSRSVSVVASDQTISALSTTVSGKLITVTVTDGQGNQTTLERFVPAP